MDIDGPTLQDGAAPAQAFKSSDVLLVFVHGFMSSSKAWEQFPEKVLADWGVTSECLRFDYLSFPHQSGDVVKAAEALRALLTKAGYQHYFHIFIFTHSTGALVVTQMFAAEFQNGGILAQDYNDLAWRVRTIINLAGAHRGGRWFTVIAWPIYNLVFGIPAYIAGHAFGRIGYFKMGGQLMPDVFNPWLRKLTSDFSDFLERRDEGSTPRPVIFNATAQLDRVVITDKKGTGIARQGEDPRGFSVGLALHFLKSILAYSGGNLYRLLAPQTPQWANDGGKCILAWDLAIDTVRAVDWFNTQDLMTIASIFNDPDSKFDQRRALDRILAISRQAGSSFTVVTGASGAGKSIVLRAAVRALMIDWISDRRDQTPGAISAPVALTINLRRLQLAKEDLDNFLSSPEPGLLWSAILRAWLPVAEDIRNKRVKLNPGTGRPPLTEDWIKLLVADSPTVIVFDSMNEFSNNHLRLKDEHLAALVSHLLIAGKEAHVKRSVICAMSSGRERIFSVGEFPMDHIPIGRLSDKKVESLLSRVSGAHSPQAALASRFQQLPKVARSAIALPSILAPLLRARNFDPEAVDSTADLLELCLRQLLADRELGPGGQGRKWPQWAVLPATDRIDILAVMAAAFAMRAAPLYSRIQRSELTGNLERVRGSWKGLAVGPEGDLVKARMVRACDMLLDEDSGVLKGTLSSTIFQDYAGIVFDHNQWADFCLGRYLCLCLKAGNLDLLEMRAFHPSIYSIAADYLVGRQEGGPPISFSDKQIAALLAPISAGGSGQFVIGNFAAIINRNAVQLDPAAIQMICDNLERIPMLGRHVMLAALCHRALAAMPNDHSRGDILGAIFPGLLARIAANTDGAFNPATRSLAWFYLRAFAGMESASPPEISWDDPSAHVHWPGIDKFVFPSSGNPEADEVRHRSLIDGYLQSFELLLEDSSRLITAIHYLLFAVIAKRERRVDRSGVIRIGAILDASGDLGRRYQDIVERASPMPELQALFDRIRAIYAEN